MLANGYGVPYLGVMSTVEAAIELIRKVCAEVGVAKFARLSGVSYTTVRDCEARDFVGPSIETLQKLAKAAEAQAAAPKKLGTPAKQPNPSDTRRVA